MSTEEEKQKTEEAKKKTEEAEKRCQGALAEKIQQATEAAAEKLNADMEATKQMVAKTIKDGIDQLDQILSKFNKIATGLSKPRDAKEFNAMDLLDKLEPAIDAVFSPLDSLGISIPGLDMLIELIQKFKDAPPPPDVPEGSFDPLALIPSLSPDLKDDLIQTKDSLFIIASQIGLAIVRALWMVVDAVVGILSSLPIIGNVAGPVPVPALTAIPSLLDSIWIIMQALVPTVGGTIENKISGLLAAFQGGQVPSASPTPGIPSMFGTCAEHTEKLPADTEDTPAE